jgi:hypothetical protein
VVRTSWTTAIITTAT